MIEIRKTFKRPFRIIYVLDFPHFRFIWLQMFVSDFDIRISDLFLYALCGFARVKGSSFILC
jgi:hypothetical protein